MSWALTMASSSSSSRVCSSFNARLLLCALVTSTVRLPAARSARRKSSACGWTAMRCATSRFSRPMSIELAAPVVDALPVERALAAAEHEREHGLGRDHVEPAALGVAAGQQLLPELVVIVEVEQGTVHVEQYRINLIPSHPVLPPPQRFAVVVYWPPIRVGSNVDRAIMPQKPRILSAET